MMTAVLLESTVNSTFLHFPSTPSTTTADKGEANPTPDNDVVGWRDEAFADA